MIADRIQRIGLSPTLRISALAKKLISEGEDVVDLSVGEPDFPTPPHICEAAKRALDRGFTKYTENTGIPELREAIAHRYRDDYSADYSPDEVIVSTGGKQCLYNICMTLLNPGDEVIISLPYWVSYPHMVRLAGGVPVYVETSEENGFRMTTENLTRALMGRTKALILNNPANPTGATYDPDDLRKIIDICLDEDIYIIADEIYEKLIYDGFQMKSVAAFGDKVREKLIVTSGFSKSFSMTGWRLGWAVGPRRIIAAMSKIQSHSTSNPTSISQWAGVEALTGSQHDVFRMRQEFESRRNNVLYRLNSIPHVSCYKPKGAFYLFPNMSWYYDKEFEGMPIGNSSGLAHYILKQEKVALIAGEGFGADDFIRISYAASAEKLEQGMDRITDALARLKPSFKAKRTALRNTITKVKDYTELEPSLSLEMRDAMVAEAEAAMSYDNYHEWNVSIGGVVLKLITNSPHLVDFWMDNWYPSPLETDLEPHGVIYVVKDVPGREPRAFYSPDTHTGLMFNSAFYPQLRSLALGIADDIASRMFNIYHQPGSCIDVDGRGTALIAPQGTGGSTHLSALLRRPEVQLHSYDGYFVRWVDSTPIADSVERKFLLNTDIIRHLPELTSQFSRSKCENVLEKRDQCEITDCPSAEDCPIDRGEPFCFYGSGRSRVLLDPFWIGGNAKHVKRTRLTKLILLTKDSLAPKVDKPSIDISLRIMEEGASYTSRHGYRSIPFFNENLLCRSTDRIEILKQRYKRLLKQAPLFVINTEKLKASEAKEEIWKVVSGD